MTTPQHDDPLGDGGGKVLQALAVLSTVGESAMGYAAARAQQRTAKTERRANVDRVAAATRQMADQTDQRAYADQQRADRRLMDHAFDEAWLASADIETAARLWRTAAMYAMGGDRRANEAMQRAQDRLSQLNPGLINDYNRHRADGMNIADAMRAAAHEVWQHQTRTTPTGPARPHGNTGDPPPAVQAPDAAPSAEPDRNGHRPVDDLEAATRAEMRRLAVGIDPDILDQLKRQWQSSGHAPAAHAAAALADTARQLHTERTLGGTATTRGGRDTDRDQLPEAVRGDLVEVPQSTSAGDGQADQGFDRAAASIRESQATHRHLTGLADQQHRTATIDPGLLGTVADEHRDGLATSTVRRVGAQHDQAAADQQRRLGRAFPRLGPILPTFSHAPAASTSQPAARRKGSTR